MLLGNGSLRNEITKSVLGTNPKLLLQFYEHGEGLVVDGSDEGPEEGTLFKLGLLERNKEGCTERGLYNVDGEVRSSRWLGRGTGRRRTAQTRFVSLGTFDSVFLAMGPCHTVHLTRSF